MLTRRAALTALACAAAAPGWPGAAAPDVAPDALLRHRLSEITLPFRPAQLDLQDFASAFLTDGTYEIRAVVRLTWAPGTRQRVFTAHHAEPYQALDSVVRQIKAGFIATAPSHQAHHQQA